MTRVEQIAKLRLIDICIANITYTYDIGLMFDVLSSEGVASEQGYNFGQWPCFKLNVSEETKVLISRLKKGEEISDEELLSNKIFHEICTYHGYQKAFVVGDKVLAECLKLIREGSKFIYFTSEYFYAYVTLDDWNIQVHFFSNYKDLKSFFKESCGHLSYYTWDEMSDEELEGWYYVAEGNDWEGLPYMEINEEKMV